VGLAESFVANIKGYVQGLRLEKFGEREWLPTKFVYEPTPEYMQCVMLLTFGGFWSQQFLPGTSIKFQFPEHRIAYSGLLDKDFNILYRDAEGDSYYYWNKGVKFTSEVFDHSAKFKELNSTPLKRRIKVHIINFFTIDFSQYFSVDGILSDLSEVNPMVDFSYSHEFPEIDATINLTPEVVDYINHVILKYPRN
jgi:hypothetical protein